MALQNIANMSLDRAANTSQFGFRIRTVPDDTFTVASFTGENHGLSQDFSFTLLLTANAELQAPTVVGNPATLEICWGGATLYLHGIVSDFTRENDTPEAMGYRAVIASPYPFSSTIPIIGCF